MLSSAEPTYHWHPVGPLSSIPRLGARVIEAGRATIALFRTADDEVFAVDDRCPHRGGPLSQGIVHGRKVTCPLHSWKIHLDSGEAVAPDKGCTASYPVTVVDGVVYLAVDPPAAGGFDRGSDCLAPAEPKP